MWLLLYPNSDEDEDEEKELLVDNEGDDGDVDLDSNEESPIDKIVGVWWFIWLESIEELEKSISVKSISNKSEAFPERSFSLSLSYLLIDSFLRGVIDLAFYCYFNVMNDPLLGISSDPTPIISIIPISLVFNYCYCLISY